MLMLMLMHVASALGFQLIPATWNPPVAGNHRARLVLASMAQAACGDIVGTRGDDDDN
jgi:hypothetical protein